MLKKIAIILLILLFGALAAIHFHTNSEMKKIIKPNNISEKKSSLQVVTFGERIEHDNIYFIQWESLNKKAQEEVKNKYKIFMFSSKEFQNKKYQPLIKALIKNKKTVLFYGYKLNVKDILNATNTPIPFYEIQSSKTVYYYLYGYGYSKNANKMLPITIMGNFNRDMMNIHLGKYLLNTYTTQKAENS